MFSDENPRDIILKPLVTENQQHMEEKKYSFVVDKKANKIR